VLSETKIRYPQIQKLLYAVIPTRRKLRHYFESHPVTVVSSLPLGDIIQCREASGRIAKWAVELMGETLSFAPQKAIKSQVLADFLAEWVDTQLLTAPIQAELWTMYFHGSLMKTGAGAGLLFISPLGKHVHYVICLHFPASMLGRRQRRHPSLEVFADNHWPDRDRAGRDTLRLIGTRRRPATKSSHSAASSSSEAHARSGPL
jgi:hypothetical protein